MSISREIPDNLLLDAFRKAITSEIERQLWADIQPIIDAAKIKVRSAAEQAVSELDTSVRSMYDIAKDHTVHAVILKIDEGSK